MLSSKSKLDVGPGKISGEYDYLHGTCSFKSVGYATSDSSLHALEKYLEDMGLLYKRFDPRMDVGLGLTFRNRYELCFGYDLGIVNRYKGSYSKDNRITCAKIYFGFRYRFGA